MFRSALNSGCAIGEFSKGRFMNCPYNQRHPSDDFWAYLCVSLSMKSSFWSLTTITDLYCLCLFHDHSGHQPLHRKFPDRRGRPVYLGEFYKLCEIPFLLEELLPFHHHRPDFRPWGHPCGSSLGFHGRPVERNRQAADHHSFHSSPDASHVHRGLCLDYPPGEGRDHHQVPGNRWGFRSAPSMDIRG